MFDDAALPAESALQRRVQIGGGIVLQAADNADPSAGLQLEASLRDLEMIVAVVEAALTFHRQIEVLDPLPSGSEDAATGAEGQSEVGLEDPQSRLLGLQARIDPARRGLGMVVPVIDHQPHPQRQR